MLPVALLLCATSTAADLEEVEYEEDEEVGGYEEVEDAELESNDDRWFSERAFHLTLYVGAGVGFADDDPMFAGSVAIGFSQRLAQRWALQGRVSFGGGFANTSGDGLFDGGPPLLDMTAEVTARLGSRRFYFGFGAFGRIFRIFRSGRPFIGGGGGTFELGFLFLDDRQLDIGVRVQPGGFLDEDRDINFMTMLSLAVGWIF